jgi:hypothetical protein
MAFYASNLNLIHQIDYQIASIDLPFCVYEENAPALLSSLQFPHVYIENL